MPEPGAGLELDPLIQRECESLQKACGREGQNSEPGSLGELLLCAGVYLIL